jgi:hypothetical protein
LVSPLFFVCVKLLNLYNFFERQSPPILTKVHFDVVMTMIADTLYSQLAKKLRGFEECDAPTIFRHFVKGKGQIRIKENEMTVNFPRRAHNPILRNVPWHSLPVK